MDHIELTDEDERFIRRQLETGDYDTAGDVVRAGLRMLEEQSNRQEAWLRSEIITRFDELERGTATEIPAEDVFARLEARHAARLTKNS